MVTRKPCKAVGISPELSILPHCHITCQKPKCKERVEWWDSVANSCRKIEEKEKRLA